MLFLKKALDIPDYDIQTFTLTTDLCPFKKQTGIGAGNVYNKTKSKGEA